MASKAIGHVDCIVLELRAGIGGHEANLFAEQLLKMYYHVAMKNNWYFKILSLSRAPSEGIREAIIEVSGVCVVARLAWEAGVHRVQRVPRTETKGRVHTSTVTLAVLPAFELAGPPSMAPQHLKIETMRSTGAGGQHVNTTDSAVRITHLPTGISAMSSQRSQHRNKATALTCLQLRLA
ncbi:MAG: PCRF domain-containing protein, partial [Candidatus Hodgkinia cicadicola]